MQSFAWLTDTHFNFLKDDEELKAFAESVVHHDPAGIFITGDISEAPGLAHHLKVFESVVQRPIYFVLGNHDFYHGDIDSVRKRMTKLTLSSDHLRYMSTVKYTLLSKDTAVVGHDGWYDGYHGEVNGMRFLMTDWVAIADFTAASGGSQFVNMMGHVLDSDSLLRKIRKVAHEGVMHVFEGIQAATKVTKNIIVLTHVPPFRDASLYNGKLSDEFAVPWYTSRMMGDILLQAARTFPNHQFTVLCGHTHNAFEGNFAPNLTVRVGTATYGAPGIAGYVSIK